MDTLLNKKFVNKTLKRHGQLLPNTIRGIICGPSNCGKTNVMLNLLFSENGLIFENVYVFSKSLVQPKYMLLECVLKNTELKLVTFLTLKMKMCHIQKVPNQIP